MNEKEEILHMKAGSTTEYIDLEIVTCMNLKEKKVDLFLAFIMMKSVIEQNRKTDQFRKTLKKYTQCII